MILNPLRAIFTPFTIKTGKIEDNVTIYELVYLCLFFYFEVAFSIKHSPASLKSLKNWLSLLQIEDVPPNDEIFSNWDYLQSSLVWTFIGLPYYTIALPLKVVAAALNLAISTLINALLIPYRGYYAIKSFFSFIKDPGIKEAKEDFLLNSYNFFVYPLECMLNSATVITSGIVNFVAAIGFTIATPIIGIARAVFFGITDYISKKRAEQEEEKHEDISLHKKIENETDNTNCNIIANEVLDILNPCSKTPFLTKCKMAQRYF